MKPRFQFSTRNALIATFWLAVFCATLARSDDFYSTMSSDYAQVTLISLVVAPPAAAAGAMFGHPRIGLLCGLASTLAILLCVALG